LTFHCSLGFTKTELYCSLNAEAANSGLGFGLLVAGSIKGPILAQVFCLVLAKEKNDFGLDLILDIAWFSSNMFVAE
jgi:hypothetical protein